MLLSHTAGAALVEYTCTSTPLVTTHRHMHRLMGAHAHTHFGMVEFVALEVVLPWAMTQDLLPREKNPWLCSCAAAEVRPMSV